MHRNSKISVKQTLFEGGKKVNEKRHLDHSSAICGLEVILDDIEGKLLNGKYKVEKLIK